MMVRISAGKRLKRLSSVNHTTKTIHHHHHNITYIYIHNITVHQVPKSMSYHEAIG